MKKVCVVVVMCGGCCWEDCRAVLVVLDVDVDGLIDVMDGWICSTVVKVVLGKKNKVR